MQKGDKVKIYQNPLTEEDFEGEATLIEKLIDDDDSLEYWEVKFENEIGTFYRWIKKL